MALPVNEIISTTIDLRSKKSADNVSKNNQLLAHMKKVNGGKMRMKPFVGGNELVENVTLRESPGGAYRGAGRFDTSTNQMLTMAKFPLRLFYSQISYTGEDELKNSGRAQQIEIVSARTEAAMWTLENIIAQSLYSDGTGLELTGLGYFLPVAQSGVCGGISRATEANWQNKVVGGLANDMSSATNVTKKINEGLEMTRIGGMVPDCGFTDSTTWLALVNEAQLQQRFGDANSASVGFKSLNVGGCDIYPDGGVGGFAPASTIYLLNSRNVHYRPAKSRHFTVQKKDRVSFDQDLRMRLIFWAGNLTMNSLRNHCRVHAD